MVKKHSVLLIALCATVINELTAAPQFRYRPQWRYDEIEFHYNNPSPYKTGVFDPYNINKDYGNRLEPVRYSPVGVESRLNDIDTLPSDDNLLVPVNRVPTVLDDENDSTEVADSSESIAVEHHGVVANDPAVFFAEEPVAVHVVPADVVSHVAISADVSRESAEDLSAERVITLKDPIPSSADNQVVTSDTGNPKLSKESAEDLSVERVITLKDPITSSADNQVVTSDTDNAKGTPLELSPSEDVHEKENSHADVVADVTSFVQEPAQLDEKTVDDEVSKAEEEELIVKPAPNNDVEVATDIPDVLSNVFISNFDESDNSATEVAVRAVQKVHEDTTEVVLEAAQVKTADTQVTEDVTDSNNLEASGDSHLPVEDEDKSAFSILNDFAKDLIDLAVGNGISADTTEQIVEDATDVPDFTVSFKNGLGDASRVESETENVLEDTTELLQAADDFEFNPIAINADLAIESTTEIV